MILIRVILVLAMAGAVAGALHASGLEPMTSWAAFFFLAMIAGPLSWS